MSTSLDEIRKKLLALDNTKNGNKFGSSDKTAYPHWNMPDGSTATIRFLPDADPNNTFFWVEKQMIKLVFPGIKGHDEYKKVEVQVPCMEMYDGNGACPILNEVRPMWKDASLEPTARQYWKKRSYIFQGFVKNNPISDDQTPDNPIRKFILTPQLFPLVKAALLDTELLNLPTDYEQGLDFIIAKTSKAGYADYTTSKWARRESALDTLQMSAIAEHGLYNLTDWLPKKPTPDVVNAMFEMFEASLNGELYDPEQWAKFYKPFGFDSGRSDTGNQSNQSVAAKVNASINAGSSNAKPPFDVDDDEEFVPTAVSHASAPVNTSTAPSPTAGKTPQEILAMLRSRNK